MRNVNENDVVRLLKDIVGCNTVNSPDSFEGERMCCGVLQDYLKEAGVETEIIEYKNEHANVVGRIRGRSQGQSLLLNGHIDTVDIGEGWTKDPFGRIENRKMYGRGTSDMKSGVAAAAAALKAVRLADIRLDADIVFTGVADEESAGPAGTRLMLEKGITADAAIVTEPTDLQIDIAQRGILWLKVSTMGRAAHGGRPWLGKNAIEDMMEFLQRLRKLEAELVGRKHPMVLSPSINVGTIRGGTRVNVVPDQCEICIDRRTIPGETTVEALSQIEEIVQDLQDSKRVEFKAIEIMGESDAFEIPIQHRIVSALREAFKIECKMEPKLSGKDATSDAALLFRAGIPTALFGPGQYQVSHTANEFVEIDKVVMGTRILAVACAQLTSVVQ